MALILDDVFIRDFFFCLRNASFVLPMFLVLLFLEEEHGYPAVVVP